MNSSRPYLVRALYEWIVDNDCTPYVLVDAEQAGVQVPRQHVKDGQIVLNVAPGAVRQLAVGNDEVTFGARFGGVAMQVAIPITALRGIYARENGQGMLFEPESPAPEPAPAGPGGGKGADAGSTRPSLKVVR